MKYKLLISLLFMCISNLMGYAEELQRDNRFAKYLKAAEKGDAEAEFQMGESYTSGKGEKEDFKITTQWYERAAKHGHLKAMKILAIRSEYNGDYKSQLYWLQEAVKKGDADAMNDLGEMYLETNNSVKIVKKDIAKALELFKNAVNLGSYYAQCNLGYMYEFGYGVKKNLIEAYKFYKLCEAREKENEGFMEKNNKGTWVKTSRLKRIEKMMSSEEVSMALKLADELRPVKIK